MSLVPSGGTQGGESALVSLVPSGGTQGGESAPGRLLTLQGGSVYGALPQYGQLDAFQLLFAPN